MEKPTNRPLAYLLAESIQDHHELEAISGGRSTISAQRTTRMTGDSAQGPEITLDFSIDM